MVRTPPGPFGEFHKSGRVGGCGAYRMHAPFPLFSGGHGAAGSNKPGSLQNQRLR
jgi:hypothetical protein